MNKYNLPFSLNFPEIKASKACAENAIDKLREEVDELDEAQQDFMRAVDSCDQKAIDKALEHILEESLDVLHAAETQLRKFAPEDVFEMRNRVIEKNDARGYYDDDVEKQKESPAGWISYAGRHSFTIEPEKAAFLSQKYAKGYSEEFNAHTPAERSSRQTGGQSMGDSTREESAPCEWCEYYRGVCCDYGVCTKKFADEGWSLEGYKDSGEIIGAALEKIVDGQDDGCSDFRSAF